MAELSTKPPRLGIDVWQKIQELGRQRLAFQRKCLMLLLLLVRESVAPDVLMSIDDVPHVNGAHSDGRDRSAHRQQEGAVADWTNRWLGALPMLARRRLMGEGRPC